MVDTDGVDVDIRYSFRITHTESQSHRVTESQTVVWWRIARVVYLLRNACFSLLFIPR